ncbi:MAG: helix-turn-helix domain-containing protein [Gammaproteobacteria bacterium]|nr:helix-turn-helix domain-containing protein [Gammaproteobacteria bacterium]MCZ6881320.1 helix-turn-helix domain-containing protein [Gammaproteobacteria bacterium]
MSQSQMATYLGVKTKTLQNWEQGIRKPTASAQTLLRVLEKEPEAVMRALCAQIKLILAQTKRLD